MRGSMRLVALSVAVLLAATSSSWSGTHCGTRVQVFWRTGSGDVAQPVNANPDRVVCDAGGGDDTADLRVIGPSANQVSVRLSADFGVASVSGVLNGLGFTNAPVTLVRSEPIEGSGLASYDSAYLDIPYGVGASGTLVASVSYPGGTETTCYRTVGETC